MSGGKGGSQTTTVDIPDWLEEAAQRNIAKAEDIAQTGFVPYSGPVVAAMTPMQEAAMRSTGAAAQAFGLDNALGSQVTPQPQEFAGGIRGYSTSGLYDQALAELQAQRPGQFAALNAPFIDPVTGAAPGAPYQTGAQVAPAQNFGPFSGAGAMPVRGRDGGQGLSPDRHQGVGYSGLRDMFDGGGPQSSTIGGRGYQGPNMDGTAGNDGPGGMGGGK